jgi:alpha-N-acetylglucosaminidase
MTLTGNPRLHRYLTDIAHVDIYWFIGSSLHVAPSYLPQPKSPIVSSSIVPWRHHFNTGQQPPSY